MKKRLRINNCLFKLKAKMMLTFTLQKHNDFIIGMNKCHIENILTTQCDINYPAELNRQAMLVKDKH